MPTSYYTPTGAPVQSTRGISPSIRAEFQLISNSMTALYTLFGAITAVTTDPTSNSDTVIPTTSMVYNAILNAMISPGVIPVSAGDAGKGLINDGATVLWGFPGVIGTAVASAATVNLTTTTGDCVHITGTTGIMAVTLATGQQRVVVFDGVLTMTHGANLILPFACNATTVSGAVMVLRGEAAGVVRCVGYTGFAQPYLKVSDQKAAGTDGGTFTSGSFATRTLNTTESNTITGASLAANQITLPAGTYRIQAVAPAYNAGTHKTKLRNITDSTDTIVGSSAAVGTATSTQTDSVVSGLFTITSAKVFELQHRTSNTVATTGYGVASNMGVAEVYAEVEIWKEA